MRVVFLGGTGPIGTATAAVAAAAGDEFFVAHSGAHEGPPDLPAVHLHGSRDELLAHHGPVEAIRPDVVIDSFFGGPNPGATSEKASQLCEFATRAGIQRVVAISSTDVYRYCWQAGLDGGHGLTFFPSDPLPLTERSPLRGPHSTEHHLAAIHDNVRMEEALRSSGYEGSLTVLRLGMVYGKFDRTREASLVEKVKARQRTLELPARGAQFFARVAVERVAHAALAVAQTSGSAFDAINVVDPYGWTYAGLAAEVGQMLGWQWDPVDVSFDPAAEPAHPFALASPCIFDDRKLRELVDADKPDPRAALEELVQWLWDRPAFSNAT
jgi:nucleoside-diphosphate-sugar epimerase